MSANAITISKTITLDDIFIQATEKYPGKEFSIYTAMDKSLFIHLLNHIKSEYLGGRYPEDIMKFNLLIKFDPLGEFFQEFDDIFVDLVFDNTNFDDLYLEWSTKPAADVSQAFANFVALYSFATNFFSEAHLQRYAQLIQTATGNVTYDSIEQNTKRFDVARRYNLLDHLISSDNSAKDNDETVFKPIELGASYILEAEYHFNNRRPDLVIRSIADAKKEIFRSFFSALEYDNKVFAIDNLIEIEEQAKEYKNRIPSMTK